MNASNITQASSDLPNYDYSGALCFIIFILVWYSLFVICLIVVQTKNTEMDYFEDSDDPQEVTARNLFKRLRSEDVKREALGKNKLLSLNAHFHTILND